MWPLQDEALMKLQPTCLGKRIDVVKGPLRRWLAHQVRLQEEQHTVKREAVDVHSDAGCRIAAVTNRLGAGNGAGNSSGLSAADSRCVGLGHRLFIIRFVLVQACQAGGNQIGISASRLARMLLIR